MKLYEKTIDSLKDIFLQYENKMAALSFIDRSILNLDLSLDIILSNISNKLKDTLNADIVDFLIPIHDEQYRIMIGDNKLIDIYTLNDVIKKSSPTTIKINKQKNTIFHNKIAIQNDIFGYLIIIFKTDSNNIDDTLSFTSLLSTQLEIMISKYYQQKETKHKEKLVEIFFNKKLKPSSCWHEIVNNISDFLPNWKPLLIDPKPKVQLLSYNENDRHLRIIGTQGKELLGTEVLIDSSICGILIEKPELNYINVNPLCIINV